MKPPHRRARIYYRDIGDYLSREKKLEIVRDMRSMLDPKMQLVEITPNEKNDWINQRDGLFDSLIPIGDKDDTKDQTAFLPQYSLGLNTNRDTWSYNFSREQLLQNMSQTIAFYNSLIGKEPVYDEKRIKWSSSLVPKHKKGIRASFDEACVRNASYRPFCKQHLYYDELFNHRQGQFPRIFPTPAHKNRVICTPGLGATKEFTCFMTDDLVDLNFMNAGTQCFPLYVSRLTPFLFRLLLHSRIGNTEDEKRKSFPWRKKPKPFLNGIFVCPGVDFLTSAGIYARISPRRHQVETQLSATHRSEGREYGEIQRDMERESGAGYSFGR